MGQEMYKRMYSVKEFYIFVEEAFQTVKYMNKAKKSGLMEKAFIERIMLAVTEVNGCELCSYMHTEQALKSGMTEEDIQMMLSGTVDNIPKEEAVGIFFAQHYAENKGRPTKEAWNRVVDFYGEEKALAILATTRVIMMGNVHGIGASALLSRFKGKAIEKSSLHYELGIIFSVIPYIPTALIRNLMKSKNDKRKIRFLSE